MIMAAPYFGGLTRDISRRDLRTIASTAGFILNPSRTRDGDVFTLLPVKRRDGREKKVVTCKEVSRRCL